MKQYRRVSGTISGSDKHRLRCDGRRGLLEESMTNKIHFVMRRNRICMAVVLVTFICSQLAEAQQLRVVTGNVEDRRSTGGHFVGLGIELKLVGDVLKEAKAVRLVVERATDETGKDLLDAEKSKSGFEQIRSSGENNTQLTLALKNPARQAAVLRELSLASKESATEIRTFCQLTSRRFQSSLNPNSQIYKWGVMKRNLLKANGKERLKQSGNTYELELHFANEPPPDHTFAIRTVKLRDLNDWGKDSFAASYEIELSRFDENMIEGRIFTESLGAASAR